MVNNRSENDRSYNHQIDIDQRFHHLSSAEPDVLVLLVILIALPLDEAVSFFDVDHWRAFTKLSKHLEPGFIGLLTPAFKLVVRQAHLFLKGALTDPVQQANHLI